MESYTILLEWNEIHVFIFFMIYFIKINWNPEELNTKNKGSCTKEERKKLIKLSFQSGMDQHTFASIQLQIQNARTHMST